MAVGETHDKIHFLCFIENNYKIQYIVNFPFDFGTEYVFLLLF